MSTLCIGLDGNKQKDESSFNHRQLGKTGKKDTKPVKWYNSTSHAFSKSVAFKKIQE